MQAVKFGITVILFSIGSSQLSFAQATSASGPVPKSRATSVQHAVGDSALGSNPGEHTLVRQVVGKQPESPARRSGSGLLGSIFGSRSGAPANTSSRTTTQSSGSQSSGLLGRLSGGSSSGRNAEGDDDGRKVIEPAPRTEEPDWSGVPFHSPKNVASAKNTQPITDPNDPSNRNKSLAAKPAPKTTTSGSTAATSKPLSSQIPTPPADGASSSRSSSGSTASAAPRVASRPATGTNPTSGSPSPVPSVPRTTAPSINTSTYQPLSATDSSRRARRRSVSPLEVQMDEVADEFVANDEIPEAESARAVGPLQEAVQPLQDVASQLSPDADTSGIAQDPAPQVNRKPMPRSAENSVPAQTVSARQTTAPPAPIAVSNQTGTPSQTGATNQTSSSRRSPMPTSIQRTDADYAASAPTENSAVPATPNAVAQTFPNPAANAGTAADAWQPASTAAPSFSANPTIPATDSTLAAPSNTGTAPNSGLTAPTQPLVNLPESTTGSSALAAPVTAPTTAAPRNMQTQQPAVAVNQQPANPPTQSERSTAASSGSSLGVTAGASNAPSSSTTNTAVAINTDANNIVGEIPGLRVITSGPADIPVRQSVAYRIVIENMSNLDAPGAMVQVKLPAWVAIQGYQPSRGEVGREDDTATRHLLWMVDGLPANTREEITLNLSATEAKTFDVNTEWAIVPKSSSARVTVREPKLDLVIEGPDQVVFGESQTYKVRVINPGTGPSESVVFTLSPNSATPQSQRIGAIPAGKEAQFEVELTARDLENLQIHGLASGEFNLKAEKIKSIQVVRAQLEAVVTGPVVKYQDAEATYNLELSNQGMAASKNVAAVLRLPIGCQYLGGIEGAQQVGNQLTWRIAELPAAESMEYTFTCRMSQTGQQKFDFSCEGSALGKASIDFITQVEAVADLVLSINDPTAPAPVGQEVVYEIVVRNRGSKVAEQVNVLAQFSSDIEPIRIEGAEGEIVPGQVKFATIAKLDAGQQVILKVFAKAEKAGHHRFCTEVSCGETLLISEEATRYMEMVGTRVSRRSSESNQE